MGGERSQVALGPRGVPTCSGGPAGPGRPGCTGCSSRLAPRRRRSWRPGPGAWPAASPALPSAAACAGAGCGCPGVGGPESSGPEGAQGTPGERLQEKQGEADFTAASPRRRAGSRTPAQTLRGPARRSNCSKAQNRAAGMVPSLRPSRQKGPCGVRRPPLAGDRLGRRLPGRGRPSGHLRPHPAPPTPCPAQRPPPRLPLHPPTPAGPQSRAATLASPSTRPW